MTIILKYYNFKMLKAHIKIKISIKTNEVGTQLKLLTMLKFVNGQQVNSFYYYKANKLQHKIG